MPSSDLAWFLGHLDAERPTREAFDPPLRLHTRGPWHDADGGAVLGSPMLSRSFERRLDPPRSTIFAKDYHGLYRWPMAVAIARTRNRVPRAADALDGLVDLIARGGDPAAWLGDPDLAVTSLRATALSLCRTLYGVMPEARPKARDIASAPDAPGASPRPR